MAGWTMYNHYIDNTPGVNEMSAYDNFLDAEYDQYCQDRDIAERDHLQEEIADLEMACRECWSFVQHSQFELGKAIDAGDDDLATECHDCIEYETQLMKGYEAEIRRLEEELAYLRC